MLKQRNEQIQFLIRLLDALVCIIAFFTAYHLRFAGSLFSIPNMKFTDSVTWILAASLTIHLILYPAVGFYKSLRMKTPIDVLLMLFKAFVAEFFILGSLVFLFQAKATSRYFFGMFLALNYSLVLVEKLGARILLSSIRKRSYNIRKVLIVGTGPNALRLIQALNRNQHWGYVPCGLLLEANSNFSKIDTLENVKVLGKLSDLSNLIQQKPIDEVHFALEELKASEVSEQVSLCEKLGVPVRFSLGFFELQNSKVTFSTLEDLPILTFYTTLMTPLQAFLKRCIDISISLAGLLITTVLYPWISWNIKRTVPGPVIFKQLRVGENGRLFKCYKFRTMYLDAEKKKQDLVSSNFMEGPLFKIENDPRAFPFGAFLRKTSLDELPQFLNILRGDMSVVGTRPPTLDEVSRYELHYRRRLSIRPGLTGLWQVSGRNKIRHFEDVLALDLKYIDHWSLWLDMQIIFRTIWITLFGRGAY